MKGCQEAPAANQLLLEEMSWPDVRAALERGFKTVIIGVGAVEQHGPHLPLFTDALDALDRAVRMARILGNALVAPVIRPGCSDHHLGFPGTISLRKETLVNVLVDYCTSLARHGFSCLVIFSSHGGNYGAIEEATVRVKDELPDLTVVVPTDRSMYLKEILAIAERCGIEPARGGLHAGQLETASVLHQRPDLVRMDRACEGWLGTEVPPGVLAEGIQKLSPVGILGDPRGATPQQGERYETELSHFLARRARQLLDSREGGKPRP